MLGRADLSSIAALTLIARHAAPMRDRRPPAPLTLIVVHQGGAQNARRPWRLRGRDVASSFLARMSQAPSNVTGVVATVTIEGG
jgi:hypothetical protein